MEQPWWAPSHHGWCFHCCCCCCWMCYPSAVETSADPSICCLSLREENMPFGGKLLLPLAEVIICYYWDWNLFWAWVCLSCLCDLFQSHFSRAHSYSFITIDLTSQRRRAPVGSCPECPLYILPCCLGPPLQWVLSGEHWCGSLCVYSFGSSCVLLLQASSLLIFSSFQIPSQSGPPPLLKSLCVPLRQVTFPSTPSP